MASIAPQLSLRRALFAVVLLAASPASAEQVMLRQTAQPTVYRPSGRAVDVLGISPGMAPDAVRAILEKQYGDVNTIQENMGLEYRGVVVATQNYITRMTARKGGDDIVVWFGTPTTGNSVVEVTRQLTFPNSTQAPFLAEVRKSMTDHYGPPAFTGPAVATGEVELMAWSYKGDQPSGCQLSSCRADFSEGLTVPDMPNYQRALRRGHDLTIIGMILAGMTDPNRASSVVNTVSDAATKERTLEAAIKQMQDGASPKPKPQDKPEAKSRR